MNQELKELLNNGLSKESIREFLTSDFLYSEFIAGKESKKINELRKYLLHSNYLKSLNKSEYLDFEFNFNRLAGEIFDSGYSLGLELALKLMDIENS